MLDPILKAIQVPCGKEQAFSVFVNEMSSWWPLGKFSVSAMGGGAAKSLRVDPKEGGEIVEIGPDDTEHVWGTIRTYDPYDFMSMDFHIPQPGGPVGPTTRVEVRFTALEDGQTRVELAQSNWEALGEMAHALRGGYGFGWSVIFEQAYMSACGG